MRRSRSVEIGSLSPWAFAAMAALAFAGPLAAARGAEPDAAAGETVAAVVDDTAALRAAWLKAFHRFGSAAAAPSAAGEQATAMLLTLSKAVVGRDLKCLVVRAGTRRASADAWVPAFDAVLDVRELKPAATVGAAADPRIRESLTVKIPRRVLLDEQDAQVEFVVTLKPGGPTLTGTYQVREGATDRTGAATAEVRPLGPDEAFPADYPVFKPAGKTVGEIQFAAVELEREACRRYRDLLWLDAQARALPPSGVPVYPTPIRAVAPPPAPVAAAKSAAKRETESGLDDLGDVESVPTEVVKKAEKVAKAATRIESAASASVTAESMREIRGHLARMRAVAERFVDPAAKPAAPVAASAPCDDPLFGPWYGFTPLASEKDRPNILPAGVGGPGRQDWRHVDHWQALGPLPADAPAIRSANLPHRFFLPGAVYEIVKEYLPRPKPVEVKKDDTTPEPDSSPQEKAIEAGMRWMAGNVEPATGILRPPQWYTSAGSGYGAIPSGLPNTTWFAATEIHCEADCEPWVALGVDEDAQVWINDRLVAAWPDLDRRQDMESPLVFKAAFRKGRNTVTARIRQLRGEADKEQATSCLWMRICTRGAPDAAATAAREAAVAPRQKDLRPFGPEVRGFRGNGWGLTPDVKPLTAWDLDRRVNVKWSVGLPATISSPLRVGDRILTTGMPHNLFCVDKMTGAIVWRATFDLLDLLEPALAAKARPLNDAYLALQSQVFHRADHPPSTSTETVKDGDASLPIKDGAQRCRERYGELVKTLEEGLKKHGHSLGFLWSSYMYAECATPVTDGRHVWLRSASGAAACFDLDGNRKWLVELPHRSSAYNAYSSPLLVDGLFIVEVVPNDKSRPGGPWGGCEWRDVVLLALDAATGQERWRTPVLNTIGTSSPVAMRLTDGREDMAVVVTGGSGNARLLPDGRFQGGFLGGTVVRVADGKPLIPNLSVNTGYGTAVAVGDVVYHCGLSQMTATRLLMLDRDTLGAQRLWTQPFFRGLEPCVTPYDGKLFANVAIGCVGGQGHAGYAVFDAATGREIPRHVNVDWDLFTARSAWGSMGRCYVPTSIAGPFVFIGDEGEGFGGKDCKGPLSASPYANCAVLEAREQGRLLAQNALPPRSNSALLFDADRVYYRNTLGLMCLAHTGDEGKAYEAEVNARFLMEDLDLEPPATGPATPIAPQRDLPPSLPRHEDLWTRYGSPLLILGPVRPDAKPGLLDALNGKLPWSQGVLDPKVSVSRDPGPSRLRRHGRALMVTHGGYEIFKTWEEAGKPAGQTAVFASVLRVCQPLTVRFLSRTANPRVRASLGGVALRHQARYRLDPGEYAYVGEMDMGEAADDVRLDFYFVRSNDDPQRDLAAWREDLRTARAYLERIVQLKPDSDTAKRAAAMLEKM